MRLPRPVRWLVRAALWDLRLESLVGGWLGLAEGALATLGGIQLGSAAVAGVGAALGASSLVLLRVRRKVAWAKFDANLRYGVAEERNAP